MQATQYKRFICIISIALIIAIFANIFLDGVDFILFPNSNNLAIIFELRLPRAIAAACSGALLACAGASIQYQFRNVLAEPGLIGVSAGAALAAAIALFLALPSQIVSICAFCGALIALILLWQFTRKNQNSTQIILTGVAINAISSSLLMLLIALVPDGSLRNITFWLMGSFSAIEWRSTIIMIIGLPLIWFAIWKHWPYLNLLQVSENSAFYAGYHLTHWRFSNIVLCSIASALVVAQCGMIGFVGLLAPQLCRLLIGNDARKVLLISPLIGALLLSIADIISRLAIYPAELPVGVITSLAGAPFFIWLIKRTNKINASSL